ncbi:MAG: toxin HicA [Acidobacteriota bacterium]
MMEIEKAISELEKNPKEVRFSRLMTICEKFFGKARTSGGSHVIFKTPWPGDPRINIQNYGGKAKPEQVKTVIKALRKLKEMGG